MRMRSHRIKLNMVAVILGFTFFIALVLCACSSGTLWNELLGAGKTASYTDVLWIDTEPKGKTDTAQTDDKPVAPPSSEPNETPSDVPDVPADTPDEVPDETPDEKPDVPAVIVNVTNSAYSYGDMVRDLNLLQTRYGDLMSLFSIGKSVDGRDLWGVRLGAETAPHTLVVTAAIHAREYLTTSLVMAQLEYCLSNYDTVTYEGKTYHELFSSCNIILLPMLNPDGVVLCQEGTAGLNTAAAVQAITRVYELDLAAGLLTSKYSIDTYCRTCLKANVNGVDLNRNYPQGWESYRKMLQPSMKNYKGAAAASEPATQAVMTYLSSLSNVSALVAFHTQGEVIYWDCGQTGTLRQNTLRLAEEVSKCNGYNCIDEQNNDASLTDWTVLSLGIPAVTVEIGTGTKYPLDYAQAQDVFDVNVNVWAAVAALYIE